MMVPILWRQVILWTAVVSFCVPSHVLLAQVPQVRVAPETPKTVGIADVAMAPGGVLVGNVVDAQGRSASGAIVSVLQNETVIASTVADANGGYVVRGLRGGVYRVVAGEGSRVCRLWAAETAPPSATPGLLVVSDPNAVLGQYEAGTFGAFLEEAKYTMTNPLVVGGIIAAAVAIPIAIHNSGNDKKSGS